MNIRTYRKNPDIPNLQDVQAVSEKLGLHPKLTELLFSRGICDESAIVRFLTPDPENLYDPFLLKGMREAVDRLQQAIDRQETLVVYGDYDADGICASAILTLYLKQRGLQVYTHIPNRIGEGYGLNIESIERIIEELNPDLILTCDCGISGHAEVEHALDLGVDMIVTDHHELAERLPECTIVNPKQTDCNYPINYLCGAGVALKLVEAMGGRESCSEFFDLAAIATVADLVPLLDENRLIVQLGLQSIRQRKNKGLRFLLDSLDLHGDITSGDIAYKVAPRINAAGRMGDAYRAFELLTSDDTNRIAEIINQINDDNIRRKNVCDTLYNEAVGDLIFEDLVRDRAIILSYPSWEKGITGIVAARLTGDFRRPSFILVNSGDSYKGTCRSIEGINVHEILSHCADLLVEYGGHAQAAGFSIKETNIPAFKQRVNEYLKQFPEEYFLPQIGYDLELAEKEIDLSFASSLDRLEPTGNSFPKPLFKTLVKKASVTPCKSNANHTSLITQSGLQILAFNYFKKNFFLQGDDEKELIVEVQTSTFGGRKSVKSVLRAVRPERLYIDDGIAKANYVKNLAMRMDGKPIYDTYSDLSEVLDGRIFGMLVIVADKSGYDRVAAAIEKVGSDPIRDFLYSQTVNNYSRIIVAPEFDTELLLHAYDKIIFVDTPARDEVVAFINKHSKAKVYLPAENNRHSFLGELKTDRVIFGKCFDAIRRAQSVSGLTVHSYYRKLQLGDITEAQFIFCLHVFEELGFLKTNSGETFSCTVNPSVKRDLSESEIYRYVSAAIA